MKLNFNKRDPVIPDTNLGPPKTRRRTSLLRTFSLLWVLALLGVLPNMAYAVPMTTNYQGYIENTEGEPLSATVNMTFALYATAQGGRALWTETHQQVEVTDGVFSLILGSTTPFDDNSLEGERYLGVTLGTDPEMTPRQQLSSVFFAMRAAVAESVKAATVETEAIADGAVTAEKIASKTITGDNIANLSGHNVTELDDVADAGSGKIISDAERQKLQGLGTGGSVFQLNGKQAYYTDGNVGIGTETPKATLEVSGPATPYPNSRAMTIHANGESRFKDQVLIASKLSSGYGIAFGGQNHHRGGIYAISEGGYDNAKGEIHLWARNNGDIVLDGKVGIGTASPAGKLHVGSSSNRGDINIDSPNDTNSDLNFITLSDGTNGLGVGSTKGWHFTARGNAYKATEQRNDLGLYFWDGTIWNSYMYFDNNSGNVGIGTTSPQYKLDVAGTIRGNNVSPSDQRLKQNIQPLENALAKVDQLRGVSFEWKDKDQDAGTQVGMIAQEVETVLPELVSTDSEGYKSLAYDKMTAVLVEAVKALKAQNDALKAIVCEDHPEKAICQ